VSQPCLDLCHIQHLTSLCLQITVQRYMTHHCSNATERPIFLLFLVIIADLETEFKLLECSASTQSFSSEALDTCKNPASKKIHYRYDCTQFVWISCYLFLVPHHPLVASFALTGASVPLPSITATNGPLRQTVASKVENICAEQSRKVASASTRPRHAVRTGTWHTGTPAWKPPVHARTFKIF
uniref:Uncharacterized protein n=1 Tax=Electrophorus electricus TaxID=8005 RepID=A0AAY5EA70_ELEEL